MNIRKQWIDQLIIDSVNNQQDRECQLCVDLDIGIRPSGSERFKY